MTRPSNVFVLCTGRCGSTTFAKAAGHASNFTAAHESRAHLIGPARLAYPPAHIEVDNRLSWWLGRLHQVIGDDAFYVHLQRDPAAVAASFAKRQDFGLMKAYRETMLINLLTRSPDLGITEIARDLIDTATANITHFLRDKTRVMTVHLETVDQDFPTFWRWIGAEGDLDAAMAEWSVRHNATLPA